MHPKQGTPTLVFELRWFHKTLFERIGAFRVDLKMRGNLDYLCRVFDDPELTVVSTSRVYTDHEARAIGHRRIAQHFSETVQVIYHYFGWQAAGRWLLHQKDTRRIVRHWWRAVKLSLFGHN